MNQIVYPIFQPVLNARNGQPLYFEALARTSRGRHTDLIDLGECFGFIHMIDIAMLNNVAAMLITKPWLSAGVNVSVDTIESKCNEYLAALVQHRGVVDRMVFEITETVKIERIDEVRFFIDMVRLMGGRIALDDWGAGHFNLGLVESLSPEFLKLSHKVVRDIAGEAQQIAGIQKVLGEGEIIAECVDCQEKLTAMGAMGISFVQGFWVGPLVDELPDEAQFIDYQMRIQDHEMVAVEA